MIRQVLSHPGEDDETLASGKLAQSRCTSLEIGPWIDLHEWRDVISGCRVMACPRKRLKLSCNGTSHKNDPRSDKDGDGVTVGRT
jgi:hypothetical protein